MMSMLDQNHIMRYMDELTADEQMELIAQIDSLDLSVLSAEATEEKRGVFSPLFATTLQEIDEKREKFRKIGIEAIREGKVGAVLLAGGQGSRLGFDKPKGTFNIGVNKELYIFECLINNLMEVVKEAHTWVPLFIMTSVDNKKDTIDFFREHKFFGYSEDNVWFFAQEQLPTVDTNGKLMLSDKGTVSTAEILPLTGRSPKYLPFVTCMERPVRGKI